MRLKIWLVMGLALGFVLLPACSQSSDPSVVAKEIVGSLEDSDLEKFTLLMHPEALRQFRVLMNDLVEMDVDNQITSAFFGVDDPDEYRLMTDREVFHSFMNSIYLLAPQLKQLVRTSDMKIIGMVNEGDTIVHVVYRTKSKVDMMNVSRVSVITLLKYEGGWRATLAGNIEDISKQLKAALE